MSNINGTINDFEKFIEFIEKERPILSATQEVLGRKDCYNLNMLLENKKNVATPSYNQDKYYVIDLMFTLSLASKLYIKANDEKGKVRLFKTPKLESFQNLNEDEKYIFLLQTYWTKYNFEIKFDRIHIGAFYNILAEIASAKKGDIIVKDEMNISNIMYSTGAAFFHHLKFFGFGELELINGAKGRYEDSIRSFSPSQFGIETSIFLLTNLVQYWNREDVTFLLEALNLKVKINKKEQVFDIFKTIFKGNTVKNTVEEEIKTNKGGTYTFKVSLSKTIWRKINLSYKHTFGDLHNAIQEAFEFDNDHLYAFYMGGNRRTGKAIYCEYADHEDLIAETTTIESLNLYQGERFLYLFDFGDEWEFNVEIVELDNEAPVPLKPMIIESKGKSPEQYRGGWE